MQLKRITDKGKTGNFYDGQTEILIVSWNNSSNTDFYAFDKTKQIRQIDQDYFALATVGENYKKIESQLPSKVHYYQKTNGQNGEVYFCTYQEGVIYGFDKNGNKIIDWVAEIGEGHPIYDIKFQAPDFLWLAFPTGQTVTQVSISQKEEVYGIGDYSWEDNNELLSYPESIFIKDNFIYIPNMGNRKLFRVDLTTKDIELYATFDEKIWQYEETEIGTFVVTDTGIYEIEEW